jgi:hypothetical protein
LLPAGIPSACHCTPHPSRNLKCHANCFFNVLIEIHMEFMFQMKDNWHAKKRVFKSWISLFHLFWSSLKVYWFYLCVCVCVSVCVYVCMSVCVVVCVPVYYFVWFHICLFIWVDMIVTYVNEYLHMCVNMYVYLFVNECIDVLYVWLGKDVSHSRCLCVYSCVCVRVFGVCVCVCVAYLCSDLHFSLCLEFFAEKTEILVIFW